MKLSRKIKVILTAGIISISAIGVIGCTNDASSVPAKQEQKNKDDSQKDKKDDVESSATKKDKKANKKIIFYTYDINTEKLTMHEKKVKKLTAKAVVDALIESNILPKGTEVNKARIEEKDGIKSMYIDVNEKFVNPNQGSTAEMLQLQCFTNSLIKSFGLNNIKLSVQGGGYSSGHIQLQENETLEFK